MPLVCQRAALLCAAALLRLTATSAQTSAPLRITVQEGAGAIVPRNALSSCHFTVLVSSPDSHPIPRATVRFRLPDQGPSGAFSSGMRSESILTDDQGRAFVHGILWNDSPGPLHIRVAVSHGGSAAEALIPVEISASAAASRAGRQTTSVRSPSSARKWLILAAGGALAGIALAGGGSAPPAVIAPPAAIVRPPSIGAPIITIGRPQ